MRQQQQLRRMHLPPGRTSRMAVEPRWKSTYSVLQYRMYRARIRAMEPMYVRGRTYVHGGVSDFGIFVGWAAFCDFVLGFSYSVANNDLPVRISSSVHDSICLPQRRRSEFSRRATAGPTTKCSALLVWLLCPSLLRPCQDPCLMLPLLLLILLLLPLLLPLLLLLLLSSCGVLWLWFFSWPALSCLEPMECDVANENAA